MFSSRLNWKLSTNQLTQLIQEKKRDGVNIADLTQTNPTDAGIVYPDADLIAPLCDPAVLRYEPNPQGMIAARAAISAYYAESHQIVAPEDLFLTSSTSEGYSWVFKLLADHGDQIMVPRPSYPLFDFLASLEGISLVPYSQDYDHRAGWEMNLASVRRGLTPRTRAIIVVTPNNPTGSYLKTAEFKELSALSREHGLALIVDEVFRDYSVGEDGRRCLDYLGGESLTLVLNGFSKMLGLPQMKLGWIAVGGPQELRREAGERLELIADTYLPVNAAAQIAAPVWLGLRKVIQDQIKDRVEENLAWLVAKVEGSPCRVLKFEGGWSAVIETPRLVSEEDLALSLLRDDNILVHPGYFFDFDRESYLVISLLAPPAIFRKASTRIMARFL